MNKKIKLSLFVDVCILVLTALVKFVDVKAIGPLNSEIGLATINHFFHTLTGTSMVWYVITQIIGYLAICVCLVFAFKGLFQWIHRKNIFKVDWEILALGVLYSITISLYVIFLKVAVNYRPELMPGSNELENSFPSSHTMLSCVVFLSAIIMFKKYIKNEKTFLILKTICIFLTAVTVVGRLLSGYHWFTDIVASILFSTSLLLLFESVIEKIKLAN